MQRLTPDRCHHCGAATLRGWTHWPIRMAMPLTLHPQPVTRTQALAHILGGGQATATIGDTTRPLDATTITNPTLAKYATHHITHQCHTQPTEAPTTTHWPHHCPY